jgi:hypothetical protein
MHSSDLLLLVNFVTNSQSLRSAEAWTPVCLPKFSDKVSPCLAWPAVPPPLPLTLAICDVVVVVVGLGVRIRVFHRRRRVSGASDGGRRRLLCAARVRPPHCRGAQ